MKTNNDARARVLIYMAEWGPDHTLHTATSIHPTPSMDLHESESGPVDVTLPRRSAFLLLSDPESFIDDRSFSERDAEATPVAAAEPPAPSLPWWRPDPEFVATCVSVTSRAPAEAVRDWRWVDWPPYCWWCRRLRWISQAMRTCMAHHRPCFCLSFARTVPVILAISFHMLVCMCVCECVQWPQARKVSCLVKPKLMRFWGRMGLYRNWSACLLTWSWCVKRLIGL